MRDIYHRATRVVSYLGGDWRYRLAGPLILELVSDTKSQFLLILARFPTFVNLYALPIPSLAEVDWLTFCYRSGR
jgi:hypothetical protein